jgi:hypothetical protein
VTITHAREMAAAAVPQALSRTHEKNMNYELCFHALQIIENMNAGQQTYCAFSDSGFLLFKSLAGTIMLSKSRDS